MFLEKIKDMSWKDWLELAASVFTVQLIAVIVTIVVGRSSAIFYGEIVKPFFAPPSWVFSPVWFTIYLLIGVSLYLYIRKESHNRLIGLTWFSVQYFLNLVWSLLFFGFQTVFWAFVEMTFLLGSIVMTYVYFKKDSKWASYLLIPYIVWVAFAWVLNISIWILNR